MKQSDRRLGRSLWKFHIYGSRKLPLSLSPQPQRIAPFRHVIFSAVANRESVTLNGVCCV